ncbi:glycerol-3-phosphate dehydrogenase [Nematocida sp. LUAm2]|nr:glycerol-3-phosphate dehydrogenase [Nematocida sp. LUAm2]
MFILRAIGVSAITGAMIMHGIVSKQEEENLKRRYNKGVPLGWSPPDRMHIISKSTSKKYDIVIVGGGSAGAGSLLDAVTRGYSVLLLEKNDFSSGTSSKSTKLIHGGIRYLEKAIKEVDYKQLSLVVEGLRERKSFLDLCPYLTREVGILLPVKNKFAIPYFWLGTKMYDWLSGTYGIQKSYFIEKKKIELLYPAIDQKKISGSMVYFDGQMDDARVNTMLIETSVFHGADAINYAKVEKLIKTNGKITGISYRDTETNKEYSVACKGVINATGPWSDYLREKDKNSSKRIIAPSIGTHLIMEDSYTGEFGMLNPHTKNGSVLFLIPWKGRTIAGTTDRSSTATEHPYPTEKDVSYIIEQMTEFVDKSIRPKAKNILSAWSGIRPLAVDPNRSTSSSQALVRSHLLETSSSGLVTIAGGKWTSYREMAEETVTQAAKTFSLPQRECVTRYIKLIGSHGYHKNLPASLSREFGIPQDISKYLVSAYGDRARKVCLLAEGKYQRIDPKYPYITAEVPYTITHEHARKPSDFLGRRSLFAYFDVRAAHFAVEQVTKLFQKELKWTNTRKEEEKKETYRFLDTMGYSLLRRMEKEEETLLRFKEKLSGACASPESCAPAKVLQCISTFYGEKEKGAFTSLAGNRQTVPLHVALKAVTLHKSILH